MSDTRKTAWIADKIKRYGEIFTYTSNLCVPFLETYTNTALLQTLLHNNIQFANSEVNFGGELRKPQAYLSLYV
ncbi:hypothetical protein CHS0354_033500 [Potamilus streckersoni]|uniref:Uncharacterized protein n=1 Tax=Potamilus streckersoni TaxID=2493646 RepID=A0AAE0SB15_9BIVA|nr:hypothetical protein CHS0354_033500 [Potamilus streckersoni]